MSERRDRLELDESVRQAYRSLPDDDVPPELDAKVMQAASVAVSQPRKPAWLKWSAPIALAASVLVVVAVVLDPSVHKASEPHASGALQPQVAMKSSRDQRVYGDVPPLPAAKQDAAPAQFAQEEAARAQLAEEKARSEVAATSRQRAKQPEDITVTARRSEERLQDVPISITVMPEADLDKAESERKHDALAKAAPAAPPPPKIEVPPPVLNEPTLSGALSNAAPATAASPAEPALEKEQITVTAARNPKIDASIEKIRELELAGKKRAAEREKKKLHKSYPDLDIEAELQRLMEMEKTPR